MREVAEKRWRERTGKKGARFLGSHMIPVVLGPKDRHYVIDHHHVACALHDEGVKGVLVSVVADLGMIDNDAFWFGSFSKIATGCIRSTTKGAGADTRISQNQSIG